MKTLKAYLEEHSLTQVEFARRVRVSQPVISAILNGKHGASIDLLVRISKETGLTLDELITSRAA